MLSQKFALIIVLFLIPMGLLAYFAVTNNDWNFWGSQIAPPGPRTVLQIKGFPVRVDVVKTPEAQHRGLSGRDQLDPDAGMLFLGDKPELKGIWMKDMRFPIDILWLDEGGVILDIKHNVPPESYPEVFYPRTPALYVLELSAGFAELHSVARGDTVSLPKDLIPKAGE